MANSADVSLHRKAATWLTQFLRTYPQLPEVEAEAIRLITDLEAYAKEIEDRPAYWFDDYPLELLDQEIEEFGGLPQNHPTRPLKVAFITKYREARGILRGIEPRCDWFGFDGERAQCACRGTQELDNRRLCPDHYRVVEARDAWKRTTIVRGKTP